MIERHIDINRFDYDLPDGRIAKFPLPERSSSKLLVYRGGEISEAHFADMGDVLPEGQLLVFNNTKVIRARIIMHKPSGARIEVFCLEPHDPADYERAFAVTGATSRNGRRATWRSISSMKAVRSTCGHGLQRTAAANTPCVSNGRRR